jgi:hypothetical protein
VAKWSDILTPAQRISFKKWITQNESAVKGLDIDSIASSVAGANSTQHYYGELTIVKKIKKNIFCFSLFYLFVI